MPAATNFNFAIRKTPEAVALPGINQDSWILKIPPGPNGQYRLAQLDDGVVHSRSSFPWKPPVTLSLRARTSELDILGTWGFGFWNDPFSFSLGLGGGTRRFPALPNTAWFFFASPQSYLSFRNDLPANGFIAQTFHSSRLPTILLALGMLGFPLLLLPWLARRLRASFQHLVIEESFPLFLDVTQWQCYKLEWRVDQVTFKAGDQTFVSLIPPNAPLGFVLWVDNQYAAFPPNAKLSYGTLANTRASWLEIEALSIN